MEPSGRIVLPNKLYVALSFVLAFVSVYRQTNRLNEEYHNQMTNWFLKQGFKLDEIRDHVHSTGCTTLVACISQLTAFEMDIKNSKNGGHGHWSDIDPEDTFLLETDSETTSNTQTQLEDEKGSHWRQSGTDRVLNLDIVSNSLSTEQKLRLLARRYKLEHTLEHFLREKRFDDGDYRRLRKELYVNSLFDLWEATFSSDSSNQWTKVQDGRKLRDQLSDLLPDDKDLLHELNDHLWKRIVSDDRTPWNTGQILIVSLVVSAGVGLCVMAPAYLFGESCPAHKFGFLNYVTGNYLSPQNCKVEFEWTDLCIVGSTVSFVVKFFQRNGRPYPICGDDNFLIEVTQGSSKVACSIELGSRVNPLDANKARVQFCARRSGEYQISVLIGPSSFVHIRGSPFARTFVSGPTDPQQTSFVHHSSTVVCTESVPYHLFIEPRDKYDNLCQLSEKSDPSDDYTVDIVEAGTNRPIASPFHWEVHTENSRIGLVLKLDRAGLYRGSVTYRGNAISTGDFDVIVLNSADSGLVAKNTKKNHTVSFDAKLLSINGDKLSKPKKVSIYVSPKQLTIKEFILKIIPKRVATFRLCPSTKFYFKRIDKVRGSNIDSDREENLLVIDDGSQAPVELNTDERGVIVATFTQFLLKNIGGSETFKDKQDFFYHEIRKLHQKHFHDRTLIKVQRDRLLESSMKTTKGFGVADWCKSFEINFYGEEALDWGGVRREWFELVCVNLFDPSHSELFHRFKNDKQGLVHPNPRRSNHLKLKYYEYAGKIVGKCLYESALGSTYRQLVKARFSRSFLAQLIGLRVHYKYFEQDDPDLYVSKIKYLIDNDVEGMDLFFTEEEYDSNGQLSRLVELIPNGSKIPVTNSNKLQYLDALAQHRLANSVKDEVEHFLKGLNDLIPDNLLAIFDENELELLLCGTGQYSIAELKANHAVSGANYEFRKILDWFWASVSNFTDEEMARLLQFTTGCSQLPPGGFVELNPKFHITSAPTFGNLPTAHTCFNQICLPDYDSFEQFDRALRLATSEGSEGFGII
ncbi:Apoptosis-resistant E3 ubiquitin protein ligase 1 [Halotydeus destructor]|nr:Apoptosis-resistant E3 ubiquitin protein ligase 1 [Halotydeus destructor]